MTVSLGTYADDGTSAVWDLGDSAHLFLTETEFPTDSGHLDVESVCTAFVQQAADAGWDISIVSPHAEDLASTRPWLAQRASHVAHTGGDMSARVDAVHAEMFQRLRDLADSGTAASYAPIMLIIRDIGAAMASMRTPERKVEQQLGQIIDMGGAARVRLVITGSVGEWRTALPSDYQRPTALHEPHATHVNAVAALGPIQRPIALHQAPSS